MKLSLGSALAYVVCGVGLVMAPGCGGSTSQASSARNYGGYEEAPASSVITVAPGGESEYAFASGSLASRPVSLQVGGRPGSASRPQRPNARVVAAANAPKDDGQRDAATDAHDVALLVYTAGINLAVFQVVEKMNVVESLARTCGGYLSKRADQQITIRVPREKFFDTLRDIETLGDVLHRDIQAVDVTDEYVDTEARLKNARSLRDRLEALLAQATVKDAMEIAKELAKVTEIIEQLEGRMKLLKNKISFATITVSFAARENAAVPDRSLLPFPWLQQMGLTPLLSVEP